MARRPVGVALQPLGARGRALQSRLPLAAPPAPLDATRGSAREAEAWSRGRGSRLSLRKWAYRVAARRALIGRGAAREAGLEPGGRGGGGGGGGCPRPSPARRSVPGGRRQRLEASPGFAAGTSAAAAPQATSALVSGARPAGRARERAGAGGPVLSACAGAGLTGAGGARGRTGWRGRARRARILGVVAAGRVLPEARDLGKLGIESVGLG